MSLPYDFEILELKSPRAFGYDRVLFAHSDRCRDHLNEEMPDDIDRYTHQLVKAVYGWIISKKDAELLQYNLQAKDFISKDDADAAENDMAAMADHDWWQHQDDAGWEG